MEIRKLEGYSDIAPVAAVMRKSTHDQNYYGYTHDEAEWMKNYLVAVLEQRGGNPHYFVAGAYDKEVLLGFIFCSAFNNHYNTDLTMDVKDMIVDEDLGVTKAKAVIRLFDAMMDHCKGVGIKFWRADSIRPHKESKDYAEFLSRKYNAETHFSCRGIIE